MAQVGVSETFDLTEDVRSDAGSFSDLLLPQQMLEGLAAAGFVKPSPVQAAAIPLGLVGCDLIVQAKSGTGKTVCFGTISLLRVHPGVAQPQVVVVTPTREIASQVADVIRSIATGYPNVRVGCFIGGQSLGEDEKTLAAPGGCHVAVGTPGRLRSLLEAGTLASLKVRTLVLDEADKLLSDSFLEDVIAIYDALPERKQVLAFSATFEESLLEDCAALMQQPKRILLCQDTVSLRGIRQYFAVVDPPGPDRRTRAGEGLLRAKASRLLALLSATAFYQAVVFCNAPSSAEWLTAWLTDRGFPAAFISGAQTQADRTGILQAVRSLHVRVLVSTDLTARGVDLSAVNLIVSLDVPADSATYMHRVGRTGRFGSKGVAVSLITPAELGRLEVYVRDVKGGELLPLPDAIPADFLTSRGRDGDPPPWERGRGALGGGPGAAGGRGARAAHATAAKVEPVAAKRAGCHAGGEDAGVGRHRFGPSESRDCQEPLVTSASNKTEERHAPRELRRGNSLIGDREVRQGSVMERLVQRLREIQADSEERDDSAGAEERRVGGGLQRGKQGRAQGHGRGDGAARPSKDQSPRQGGNEGAMGGIGAMGPMGAWPSAASFGGWWGDWKAGAVGLPAEGAFPGGMTPAWGPWAAMMATWEWEWWRWRHEWYKWAMAQGQARPRRPLDA